MWNNSLVPVIFGMALMTWLPRFLPMWLLSSRKLPDFLVRWLELVPPAVLAALLVPGLLLRKDAESGYQLFLSGDNIFLLAAVPSVLVCLVTRSFFGTVAVGMLSVALLRAFV